MVGTSRWNYSNRHHAIIYCCYRCSPKTFYNWFNHSCCWCCIYFGANIGTCITAVIAALGGSISTKRAAWFHVVYNLAGAIIGMLVLKPFVNLTNWVNLLLNGSQEMYIAQVHFIFNIASTILVIPFVRYCVILLEKLIPGNDHHDTLIENIDE